MKIAVIPARKGSKSLKHKNIQPLCGKPLISYTIEAALEFKLFDKIIITTDFPEVIDIAKSYKVVTLKRPAHLCQDDTPLVPVIINAARYVESVEIKPVNSIVTLQPTSPLRTSNDISLAYEIYDRYKPDSLISVTEEHHSIWTIDNKNNGKAIFNPTQNRQYIQPHYLGNGAIFITRYRSLKSYKQRVCGRVKLYVMDKDSSIDIHTEEDLKYAEYLMLKRKGA